MIACAIFRQLSRAVCVCVYVCVCVWLSQRVSMENGHGRRGMYSRYSCCQSRGLIKHFKQPPAPRIQIKPGDKENTTMSFLCCILATVVQAHKYTQKPQRSTFSLLSGPPPLSALLKPLLTLLYTLRLDCVGVAMKVCSHRGLLNSASFHSAHSAVCSPQSNNTHTHYNTSLCSCWLICWKHVLHTDQTLNVANRVRTASETCSVQGCQDVFLLEKM